MRGRWSVVAIAVAALAGCAGPAIDGGPNVRPHESGPVAQCDIERVSLARAEERRSWVVTGARRIDFDFGAGFEEHTDLHDGPITPGVEWATDPGIREQYALDAIMRGTEFEMSTEPSDGLSRLDGIVPGKEAEPGSVLVCTGVESITVPVTVTCADAREFDGVLTTWTNGGSGVLECARPPRDPGPQAAAAMKRFCREA